MAEPASQKLQHKGICFEGLAHHIADHGCEVLGHQNIWRLQIQVEDLLLVQEAQATCHI